MFGISGFELLLIAGFALIIFGPQKIPNIARTAGRFMRGLYGYVKAAAFIFLTGWVGYLRPEAAGTWLERIYGLGVVYWFGWLNVWLAIALTLIRGLPVIFDAMPYIRSVGASPDAPSQSER